LDPSAVTGAPHQLASEINEHLALLTEIIASNDPSHPLISDTFWFSASVQNALLSKAETPEQISDQRENLRTAISFSNKPSDLVMLVASQIGMLAVATQGKIEININIKEEA